MLQVVVPGHQQRATAGTSAELYIAAQIPEAVCQVCLFERLGKREKNAIENQEWWWEKSKINKYI